MPSKREPWQPGSKPKPKRRPAKARQMLSSAILARNHELASWIDMAVKTGQVLPKPQPQDLQNLKLRLDEVMEPLTS